MKNYKMPYKSNDNTETVQKINVLYFTNTTVLYGANKSLLDMLDQLKTKQINVYVAITKRGEIYRELRRRNIKAYCIPYMTNASAQGERTILDKIRCLQKNLLCLKDVKKVIVKNKIDIIHSNASNIDIGAMAALYCRLPHVWHVRELLYEDYRLKYDFPHFVSYLFDKSAKIIAISKYVSKKRQFTNSSKVSVLYNGLNIDTYSLARKDYFNKENLNILYAGVISKEKGISDIIKAIRYLADTGYKKVHLYIAGSENPYWKKVERYIQKNKLEQYITYCGYQKDLKELREKADIAVMCSRSEALGRVTIESMLSELLVIGANAGATKELVEDGVTGYLYEVGNYKQFAEKIKLVKDTKKKSEEIVKNAKEFAQGNFDSSFYADKIFSLYQACVENKRKN